MKRIWALIATLALLVGMLSVGGSLVTAATFRLGDVNGNGAVDTGDVRALLNWIVSNDTMSADLKAASDFNRDGKVNSADAKAILLYVMSGDANREAVTVDLLAPSADDWHNPVLASAGAKAIVSQEMLTSGATRFTNAGGIWPYSTYIYDEKLLLPEDAVIEYDFTMTCDQTSINFYVGDSLPDLLGDSVTDVAAGRQYFKLQKYIAGANLDAGSDDLKKGTYKGSVKVSDLDVSDKGRVDGMVALTAIKVYTVGATGTTLTINKLQVTAYKEPSGRAASKEPLEAVRPALIDIEETVGLPSLTAMELYVDGERSSASSMNTLADNKKIYHTITSQRIYNYARGYKIDVPMDWQEDYTLGAIRSRYTNSHFSLTLTREDRSTYGNTAGGWETYRTEWLDRYINDSTYLSNNGMKYQRTPVVSTSLLSGYEVRTYDIEINNKTNLDMPFYSIAVIRKPNEYNLFYLMILKADVPTTGVIDRLVRSFERVTMQGTSVNVQGQYEAKMPSTWNAETKAYYEKLLSQQETDFGFFSASMVPKSDSSYTGQRNKIQSEYNRLSAATGYEYAIMPTYTHLKYGSTYNNFPTDMANEFAGGNGFNGKPVLQFTYQFTTNNNGNMQAANPVFDVLRGTHDAQFRKLAKEIKAYGKPVLFRLNNEMNTDWTSYCGIVSLLDTDVFVKSWQRMYDIFRKEGVDNCIWIFNPITPSIPYCAWGDTLCYMPGEEYVQALGLTNYEMGNESKLTSFQSRYTECYESFKDYFINQPWIISEFAAGSGGEKKFNWTTDKWETTVKGRNASQQATWVRDMFTCLNNKEDYPFCRNIVGAVWFSVNDYTTIDGKSYILNYLALDAELTKTLAEFKKGFAAYGQ